VLRRGWGGVVVGGGEGGDVGGDEGEDEELGDGNGTEDEVQIAETHVSVEEGAERRAELFCFSGEGGMKG